MRSRETSLTLEEVEFLLRNELATAEFRFGPSSGEVGLVLIEMVQQRKLCAGDDESIARLEKRINSIVQYYLNA